MSGEILSREGLVDTALTDVISTIWTEYSELGISVLNEKKMNYMIIESDKSFIVATHLYGYIIVFKASNLDNLGLMKLYIEKIAELLYEIFAPFESVISDKEVAQES